ncbi:hypothetical protein SDC9_124445 [bioreactor metagenome]|uniref:Uncharacterized protein n=1 Tax=bioreactor metagenome TaxID=1076179 RepID=A0A645CL04_9ZZZZ
MYLSCDASKANVQLFLDVTARLSIIVLPSAIPESATLTEHSSLFVITERSIAAHTASESCTGVLSKSHPTTALSYSVLCSIIFAVNSPANVPKLLSFFASSSVSDAEWVESSVTRSVGTDALSAI